MAEEKLVRREKRNEKDRARKELKMLINKYAIIK